MKSFKNFIIPLGVAGLALLLVTLTLPFRAAASEETLETRAAVVTEEDDPSPDQIEAAGILPGSKVQISGAGGRLPEVAANGHFVAMVFESGSTPNNRVYIRAVPAGSGWGFTRQLDSARGSTPKLAFSSTATDTVYVVWEGDGGQNIKFTTCILDDPLINCATASTVNTVAGGTGQLRQPDIAVDSAGNIHLAWVDRDDGANPDDNKIKTSRSSNGGSSWSSPVSIDLDGGDSGGQPVLATGGSPTEYVHLSYKDDVFGTWAIFYLRSSTGNHNWTTVDNYDESEVAGFEEIANPAIAVAGSKVYLAWDNNETGGGSLYALAGVESANSGGTWPHGDPGPEHITSTNLINSSPVADEDEKLSYSGATPVEEDKLRPSLAVNGSNFAVVWQQRPGSSEGGPSNCTSEIYYAPDSSDWTSGWGIVTANDPNNYSIDPDIAVDSNGVHVVFMQAADDSCNGGAAGSYSIYYWGPFDEFNTGGGIYLPLVLKNS